MNEILSCFGNIIGTTVDSLSDSTLYITDLEAVETITALIREDSILDSETDLENKLLNARRIAILRLHSDLTTLMMRYAKARPGFSGVIGSTKSTSIITETGKSGLRILCKPVKDAEFIFSGVTLTFSQTGTLNLYMASNYSDDIVDLGLLNVTANKPVKTDFDSAFVLPMYDNSIEDMVEYYIYHENNIPPKDTKIDCATCVKFYFDQQKPLFKQHSYKQYLNVAGFNGDISDIGTRGYNSAKGIQLHVDVRCNTHKAICNGSIDFNTNPMAMSYATAIQYKAASVAVWDLIRSPGLNRVLMGDMESFREAATYYERKYNDMVKYISKNMDIQSDCFCETGFTNAKIGNAI